MVLYKDLVFHEIDDIIESVEWQTAADLLSAAANGTLFFGLKENLLI